MVCLNSKITRSLNKVQDWFKKQYDLIDQEVNLRSRKISTRDVHYLMTHVISNNCSYTESLANMKIDNLIDDISVQAFNNRIINGKYVIPFEQLNKNFIRTFMIKKDGLRPISIDGSKINLPLNMTKYGFGKARNRPYATGLIGALYDINNNMATEYHLSTNPCERTMFYQQLIRLKNSNLSTDSDLFIFDRGYYSSDMVDRISNLFQNFIYK